MTTQHFNPPSRRPRQTGVYPTRYVQTHDGRMVTGFSYWCTKRQAWAMQSDDRGAARVEGTRFAETSFESANQAKQWADSL